MRKIPMRKRLLSIILVVAMVVVGVGYGGPKHVNAATDVKLKPADYLNTTEKYLTLGVPGSDTYDFNIKKQALKEGDTYSWYVKTDKGTPDTVTINKKTGVVTAKKAGIAYIRCKITLADGTILRPEAKVTVRNNITEVGIKTLPEKSTMTAGTEYDFDQVVLNTTGGKNVATEGITRFEITEDTAEAGSASSEGVVFPLKEGSFKIRAVCFQSTSKYNQWLAEKKVNTAYITAASEWATITVVTGHETATVSNQLSLYKALVSGHITQIMINTKESLKFNIPTGNYLSKTLSVNAPYADVENHGNFKDITINAIKDSTWIEYADGNVVNISDDTAGFVIDKDAHVKYIVIDQSNSLLNIEIKGLVDEIIVRRNAVVNLSGSSEAVPVTVEETAGGSTITSSVPLNLDIKAKAEIVLDKGAEETKIDKSESKVEVKIENNTQKNLEIVTNKIGSEKIESGTTVISVGTSNYSPNQSGSPQITEASLVQAYTDAASPAAFVTLLNANALGLTLTDYAGLDATGKTTVGTALLAVDTFADKAAVQSAVTTAIANAKPASDARLLEAAQVKAYTDAASAAAFVTLLNANALGLTLTDYAGLDATGKTAVGTALLAVDTFADKAAVQSAVTTAIANAKPDSEARIAEALLVKAYTDAADAATFVTLLNANALGLTLTDYSDLDATGKTAVGAALLLVNTFADKAAVQSAVTTAITNAKTASDARILEAARVKAYTDAADAVAFVTLLNANALGLTLTDYAGLDATGKTEVGTALLLVNTFADKAAVQSAVTTAITNAKTASDARILEAARVKAYTDAADAAAFVTLLNANALGLTLTDYAGLDATGKTTVGTALLTVDTFADKAAVQSAVTTAIANAKPDSEARIAEALLVKAYTDAVDAATFVTLLNANALGLTLTDYAGLDAAGKTAVGTALLAVNTFADKAAVQSAVTTAIANAKPDSDARTAEAALVQAYTNAADAATFVTLLNTNALGLTLTDYAGLDATGKTAVGTAMLAVNTFADKAAVQSAVITAIANAKPASDARIAEAALVQAYTDAADAAAFVTLLNANALGLTLTDYAGLDATGKTEVGTTLLAVNTFADKAAVQSAVTTAIANAKTASDARILEAARVKAYTDAADAAAFVTLLNANALGLTLTDYAGLDATGKTEVGTALLAVNTFADKAAVQSAVTTAIANAKPASDARILEAARVKAYTDAADAATFVTLLNANALGLTLTDYAGLDATGKTEVGTALLAVNTFADKAAVQSAVTTAIANAKPASDARIAEAALVQAYTDAADAAAFVTLLNANALGLTLTDYAGLDATGKTEVGTALLAVNTFADKTAVQSAVTTAITNAKLAYDARILEAARVQAYTNAGDAATFVSLLDENDLGLTLTDYAGLDATGKTAVGAALLVVDTFADKAAVQSAVTTAITNAKPASDARKLEAARVKAYTDAADAATFVSLLNANALGLTITDYSSFNAAAKTAVGTALLAVDTFADKAAVQSAVTTAIANVKLSVDADNTSIADARALIPSTFTATQGTDTNLLTILNALSGMAAEGVTLTLTSSNANVANDGAITYSGGAVTGDVVVKINKTYGAQMTATVSVTIPMFLATTIVGNSTFQYTTNSTGITLLSCTGTDTEVTVDYIGGQKVTEVVEKAFNNYSSLTKITISTDTGSGSTVIVQRNAIYGCDNITTIVLGVNINIRSSSVGPTRTIQTIAGDNLAFTNVGTYILFDTVYEYMGY